MTHLSIRWRLTLWYATALAVILTGFCLILLLLMRQQLLGRTDSALREELQELVLEVRLAKNQAEFQDHLHARFFQHDIYDFVVSNQDRKVLFASSGVTAEQATSLALMPSTGSPTFASATLSDAGAYRIASHSVEDPRGRVTVQALTSLKPFYSEVHVLRLLMLVLLPLGILFALCGGYFLAARALAPVQQIAKLAQSITIADLDRRIQVSNPHDEIGHLAMMLNSFIARLEQAVDEIQRFTADASHELRTPLAVLRAEAESALLKKRTTEDYERTLAIVIDEATRLGALTDQLLTLSRHDAGIIYCRKETIRIDALLLDVVEQLRPSADSRGIRVDCDPLPPCEFMGDDIRLRQALFNVLDNAIKYSSPDTTTTVRCAVINGWAHVTIQDAGIGIPPVHLPKVFDRFYRVDPARQSRTGGTGLGLAIARTAVQAHEGEITIDSVVDVGTTVVIRLPNASPETADLQLNSSRSTTFSKPAELTAPSPTV